MVKNPPADVGDTGSIPGSGRSPGREHGNPLQYSCLKNLMDRGAWQATVHRVTQNQTQLKRLSMHTTELRRQPLLAIRRGYLDTRWGAVWGPGDKYETWRACRPGRGAWLVVSGSRRRASRGGKERGGLAVSERKQSWK